MRQYPSKEILDSRLIVDEGGNLYWKETGISHWDSKYAGKLISCVGNHGYIVFNLTVDGKKTQLLAHRVVYIMTHGVEPNYIDHADGVRTNNHPSNIRSCSQRENMFNMDCQLRSQVKVKGVHKREIPGRKIRYLAQSSLGGKSLHIGSYDTIEQAKEAYANHVNSVASGFYKG